MSGNLHSRGPHKFQSQRTLYDLDGNGHEFIVCRTKNGAVLKYKEGTAGKGSSIVILQGSFEECWTEMLKIYTGKIQKGWTSRKPRKRTSNSSSTSPASINMQRILAL